MAVEPRVGFSVSVTTRAPRAGEVDGRDYHFASEAEFDDLVATDALLEWANVYDHRYGTPRSEVARLHAAGRDALFDLDIVGGHNLMRRFPNVVSVFVLPPEYDALRERLVARGKDDEATIDRRLRQVASQCVGYEQYRYLVVNDDLEAAATELVAIVRAERAATSRRRVRAERVLATFEAPHPEPRR
jgi:guanylate kinase